MIKTQVYIPEKDNVDLLETSRVLGIKKSEAIRQAVHEYCQEKSRLRYQQMVRKTAGVLKENPLDALAIRSQTNEGFNA
jgi:metal-responsive CopG/Arc/MetJ family transcriptional regulator